MSPLGLVKRAVLTPAPTWRLAATWASGSRLHLSPPVDATGSRSARLGMQQQYLVQQQMTVDAASPAQLPPGAELHESWWTWEGSNIRYLRSGDAGPPLLCVHGFGVSADLFRRLLPMLGAGECRAHAIDLLGHGLSSKPDPRTAPRGSLYSYDHWAHQLQSFVREVVDEPALLLCNSAGGIVGLQAALEAPSLFPAVQLINVSLRRLHVAKQAPWQRPVVAAVQALLRNTRLGNWYFRRLATPQGIRNVLRKCYGSADAVTNELVETVLTPAQEPGAMAVFLECISDSGGPLPEQQLAAASECGLPVSILWGVADPWERVECGRALAAFPAVEEFVELQGLGHCAQDEAPEVVAPLVLAFVARHSSNGT